MKFDLAQWEKFVTTWQCAHSLEEVAASLEIEPRHASQRATWMRKLGIDLKKFARTRSDKVLHPGEIARLKELARRALLSTAVTANGNGSKR